MSSALFISHPLSVYFSDDNWGLGLAIAANLHVPYRIEIGRTIPIIITAPLNDASTTRLLTSMGAEWARQAQEDGEDAEDSAGPRRRHTKILLIDMAASSLDVQHGLYKYLTRIGGSGRGGFGGNTSPPAGMVSSNLLVLTLLSDRHRHFLNAAGLMATMQSFRTPLGIAETGNHTEPPPTGHGNASLAKLLPFHNLFPLYDTVVATATQSDATEAIPKYDFVVLDIVRDVLEASYKWRPLLILESVKGAGSGAGGQGGSYTTHSIQPGYDEWLLVSSVLLWQCGAICWTIAAICVGLLVIVVAGIVAAGIAMRNYFLRKRLSKGPNKIVLSASDFVFPVDSRRVDEGIEAMLCCWLQQLQEFGGPEVDKPDLLKGSIGSLKNLGFVIPGAAAPGSTAGAITASVNGKGVSSATGSLARHNPAHLDMRARYNGDLVQLKEVHMNGSVELRTKAMDLLVMAHGLRHENINPLIGWLSDPNRTAMVFDYCSRGSLQDVLIMDEIKLDWSFRLSLLTDLVRGMRYLHTSPLRVHGALTSRNCVVDARWVLKITDYGLNSFYESQGLPPRPRSAKELLWTAPELLRSMKHHQQQHHHHHQHGRTQLGTQLGDVYSFGIIMQEVVVRGEPYCMLSLAPEEIIAKIKKPPPLIRPSVSKGAAPPEAINIMRQCWAEQPDMRPDFNSVYERFKMLNHGRKVNFVDTMFQMLEKYSNNLEELIRERTEQLDIERKKTEQLLNRMLPSSVAEKLKMGLAVDPEEFSDVTIYFSDIVGFTTIAAHCSPVQVVDLLNDLYTIFDATINAYNVYKVETIGDAYMVVSGLPVKIPDHAEQIATMALDLLHQSGRFNVKHLPGVPLQLRIGLHTGPCCAGVVGLTMPRYCLFGDTVNTASRMESTGSSWRIHMSQETRDRLEARGGYAIEQRGLIDIKGKGMMNTFWLLGKKGFDKPLPAPPPIGESHGLDESLIRNSITLKAQANKSRTSTNPSSSQSSSLAGESVEVKVEITPPTNADLGSGANLPNSYSLDSNSTNTISPNATLCPEFPGKTTPSSASPQSRKLSELTPDNLLNPNSFNRLPNSTGGSSSRLYKKIEEMMDLSSPYNHYKCLSPSESNLTQFYDGKYVYGSASGGTGGGQVGGGACSSAAGSGCGGGAARFDSKPGSSRLLRRQFSLDRDDQQAKGEQQHHQHSLQATTYAALVGSGGGGVKTSMLDIPLLHDTSRSPKGTLTRAHKQNSASITQDLEKIEEIPLSPASSQHHSSLDSNLNRSPPSTLEAQSPPLPPLSPPQLSAPTSPAPSRTLNGMYAHGGNGTNDTNDSSSHSHGAANNNNNGVHPGPELTLNVEQLLSR
uniref:Guanylate cyclase n=1 Tax=Drosophila rhopaloa TaxID=1041015 RepID=A0A6P4ES69_DRORH